MRRLLSHAFSESALREQESILTAYFDLLVSQLEEQSQNQNIDKVDLTRWYNFTTFDIIGFVWGSYSVLLDLLVDEILQLQGACSRRL